MSGNEEVKWNLQKYWCTKSGEDAPIRCFPLPSLKFLFYLNIWDNQKQIQYEGDVKILAIKKNMKELQMLYDAIL